MLPAHELWYLITKSNSKTALSDDAWEKLKEIAQAMENEDFTFGEAGDIGKKLALAFGYESLTDFKNSARMRERIDFISRCIRKTINDYGGIFNQLVEAEISIRCGNTFFSGTGLKSKFYADIKEIIGSQRRDNNNIRISDIAFDSVVFGDQVIPNMSDSSPCCCSKWLHIMLFLFIISTWAYT